MLLYFLPDARAHDGARLVVTRQFEVKLLRVELGLWVPVPPCTLEPLVLPRLSERLEAMLCCVLTRVAGAAVPRHLRTR